jgi:hypothetical protein
LAEAEAVGWKVLAELATNALDFVNERVGLLATLNNHLRTDWQGLADSALDTCRKLVRSRFF